jgi:gamma-D-glutamyl-L-lysine dipeptidyl-peptidase
MTSVDLAVRMEELRLRHVPDRRLGVWDVALDDGDTPAITGAVTEPAAIEDLRALAGEAGVRAAVELLPAAGGELRAIAHRSLAHLRAEPRHSAELVSQMILGEEALVLRARDDWLQVQTWDRYVAWVHHRSIVRRDPGDLESFRAGLRDGGPPAGRFVVTARGARAVAEPAPYSAPVADLVQGAIVEPGEARGRFLEVVLPDGASGWVARSDAVPADRLAQRFTPSGRAIVEHAAQFLGLPYLWGGTSEKGFDCSGFVQRLFGLHGARLPRDSDQQSVRGEAVDPGTDWSGVDDGDLAFFAEPGAGRATHVGILAEGGRLLHASTSRNGVAWDALDPAAPRHDEYAARLASMLTGVRRVALLPEADPR